MSVTNTVVTIFFAAGFPAAAHTPTPIARARQNNTNFFIFTFYFRFYMTFFTRVNRG